MYLPKKFTYLMPTIFFVKRIKQNLGNKLVRNLFKQEWI
ncbi:hypothetical protein B4135_3009 [Caldibacillus debilis]|uniref:Uncharacterized protein n=1 Tax=Caldibacillus debilis TaxID=301148 RepID=A0A150LM22_9BACI|nr:hypothetical protein B4135_3009 [Caldibacillus debilis]